MHVIVHVHIIYVCVLHLKHVFACLLYILQDICVSAAFAVLLFISGIPLAVFASQWADKVDSADSDDKGKIDGIPPSLQAASVCVCACVHIYIRDSCVVL